MKGKVFTFLIVVFCCFSGFGQNTEHYQKAFSELFTMLQGKKQLDLKKAVFEVENAYMDAGLNYDDFTEAIKFNARVCRSAVEARPLPHHKLSGRGPGAAGSDVLRPPLANEHQEKYRTRGPSPRSTGFPPRSPVLPPLSLAPCASGMLFSSDVSRAPERATESEGSRRLHRQEGGVARVRPFPAFCGVCV